MWCSAIEQSCGCTLPLSVALGTEMPMLAGKYTVPVFWDKKTGTIVNNESSEILRFLNSEFQDLAKNKGTHLHTLDEISPQ